MFSTYPREVRMELVYCEDCISVHLAYSRSDQASETGGDKQVTISFLEREARWAA
jgi:hypothetical protein